MSGTLGLPIAAGTLGALIDGLFPASFRGVEFHMPDVRHEAGRRVVTFLFPGRDTPVHEDIGATPGRITVTGLIIGDDYVRRAKAMEEAFATRGPATLDHPWYGEIEVVLVSPATITLSEREIRLARFDATFERYGARVATPLDTLGRLIAAADALRDQARGLLRTVLAPARLVLGTIATASAFASSAATGWRTALAGVRGGGTLRAALAAPLAALEAFALLPADQVTGDSCADAHEAVPAAASAAAVASPAPAIGPGTAATAGTEADPRAAATLLLAGAAALAGPVDSAAPFRLAARAMALAEAARVVIDIPFESAGEARTWRGRLDAALTAAATAAAALAASEPAAAGLLLRSLTACRTAAAADLDERIGRLSEVTTITAPIAGTSAWLVAQHLAGDDPGRVVALHADLVARNALPHPAMIQGGRVLEALV